MTTEKDYGRDEKSTSMETFYFQTSTVVNFWETKFCEITEEEKSTGYYGTRHTRVDEESRVENMGQLTGPETVP